MISHASSVWTLRAAFALGTLFFTACGEEPSSVVGHCEDIPLYRQIYDAKTDTWTRYAVDGGPLSAEDNERIDAELNRSGPRCLTPIGPTASSSGGASSTDDAGGGDTTDASSGGDTTDASIDGSPTDDAGVD